MSLVREVFSGYAQRIRLENHLQLESAKAVRPEQIRMQAAAVIKTINDELKDPELKAIFESPLLANIKAP